MLSNTREQSAGPGASWMVRHLVGLAVRGLPQMLNRDRNLFCYKLKKTPRGLVQEGISPRYTAMTLMGLHKLQQAGTPSPIDLDAVLNALQAETSWVDNIGDLGLLLWTCAVLAPERLDGVDRQFDVGTALYRYADAQQGRTMELAWFLSGLCHWALARPDAECKLGQIARAAYRLLSQNQHNRVFAHFRTADSLKGRVRASIGSFADQVYPLYAFCRYYQAFGEPAALQRATDCADGICGTQGSLGQWWWHYESHAGRVFEDYPVYSVHQHGMGPMALRALSSASKNSFDLSIYKGLDWVYGHNELSFDMNDSSASMIWRCIQPSSWRRYSRALLRRVSKTHAPSGLKVLFECRPYELGWLLYALADLAAGAQPSPHSAGRAIVN